METSGACIQLPINQLLCTSGIYYNDYLNKPSLLTAKRLPNITASPTTVDTQTPSCVDVQSYTDI